MNKLCSKKYQAQKTVVKPINSSFSLIIFWFILMMASSVDAKGIIVASKRFTESYILSAVVAKTLQGQTHVPVTEKQGLGSTGIVFNALLSGEVDVYPEYWGTLTREILKVDSNLSLDQVNALLFPMGIKAGIYLGFNNTYALAIRTSVSDRLGIHNVSDLRRYPNLRFGLSQEFLVRADGWQGLAKMYKLTSVQPTGLDHGLGYRSIEDGQFDVIDAYSTDSHLTKGDLVLLKDDLNYFDSYQALLLMRLKALSEHPDVEPALSILERSLTQEVMQQLNAHVENQGESVDQVAKNFLAGAQSINKNLVNPVISEQVHQKNSDSFAQMGQELLRFFSTANFLKLTLQQALLVGTSLLFAVMVGIPLGVCAYAMPRTGRFIQGLTGVIQTVPSLALLSFLILLMHTIGFWPAFTALVLYGLLPIIESTQSGLRMVDKSFKEASAALGTGFWMQLIKIELPLCTPSIFAGIQVAAVWTTGTATIAAFVGAGGYGELISQGLSTNNTQVMLSGAVPAAIFALLIQWLIARLGQYFQLKD
jgi:osmoprotectant transport system permease protein